MAHIKGTNARTFKLSCNMLLKQVIAFLCSIQPATAHKTKIMKREYFSCFNETPRYCIILLINVKMPTTIVGILTLMSRIDFLLS